MRLLCLCNIFQTIWSFILFYFWLFKSPYFTIVLYQFNLTKCIYLFSTKVNTINIIAVFVNLIAIWQVYYFNTNIIYNYTLTITLLDVERSFSRYKNILSDNRRSFDMENIKKVLSVQYNLFTGMRVTIYLYIYWINNK
jgi:hypothetical protein